MIMMMGLGLIVPFLLLGAVVYALGYRPQLNQTWSAHTSQTPLEILEARYANVEITGEAYDHMHRDL